ncbi:MAG: helix-turn-helix transcriptional regulator [Nitrospira sp.]|nr:helix-turn-helix transcriptional regulator [Nitrospira sp.]
MSLQNEPVATSIKKLSCLTNREREVLEAVATGEPSKVIGRQFGISSRTVQKHLQRVYAKLGVRGRIAAVLLFKKP